MNADKGTDGGLFVPKVLPVFSEKEIRVLSSKSFSEIVAETLNIFFDCNLSGWDIDFSIGRYPIRLKELGRKTTVAECWHNPEWSFQRYIQNVADRICPGCIPGFWEETAVRIAVLFAITAKMISAKEIDWKRRLDISVFYGSMSGVLSVLYAKKMGLPIGKTICCCNENSSIWELMHQGQLHTDGIGQHTSTPEGDVWLPIGLEQYVYSLGGAIEVQNYLESCRTGLPFIPAESFLKELKDDLYVSVSGENRIKQMISGSVNSFSYILSPYTAVTYAGVQDYRVSMKETGQCIILDETSPELYAPFIADALHISETEVKSIIQKQ